ncbi:MAG: hypothetical protein EOO39_49180, partial [Cytophagaceae bacterium]
MFATVYLSGEQRLDATETKNDGRRAEPTYIMIIGGKREARRAYGLDELALAPGTVNIDPDDIEIGLTIGNLNFPIPFLASAMDGAVDARVAIELSRLGGLGVMNGEGLQTRYENVEEAIQTIIDEPVETVVPLIQKMYREPVKPELIAKRVQEIKAGGGKAVLAFTPVGSKNAYTAIEAGADAIVIATTVTTLEFRSTKHTSIDLPKFCKEAGVPVIVGNATSYDGVYQLMEAGAACVLIGVGPGAACTTRRVLGLGVPQAT